MVSNPTTLVSRMIYSKCKGKYLNLLHLTKKSFVELYKSELPQTASPPPRGLWSGRHLTVGSRTFPPKCVNQRHQNLPSFEALVPSFILHFIKLNKYNYSGIWASQMALVVKNPPANAGGIRDTGLIPGLG